MFCDGDKIGVFDGEKVTYFESEYITRYREYAENHTRSESWKYEGNGARFRGDYEAYGRRASEKVYAYINGVQWDGEKIIYSFTVNGSSGVYRKDIENPKAQEEHILSSADEEILSIHSAGSLLAVTVKNNAVTSAVGTLDCNSSELKTLTGGDSRDQNPYFSPVTANMVYFDSAGVGLDAEGNFTGKYAPSAIYTLNLDTMSVEEAFSDKAHSYIKPKQDKDGTLYCIERPNKEKRGGNPLIEILLIPYRILQAFVMFVQSFVILFTGKSLTSGGDNPTKGRDTDSKKLFVDGNVIEAERELKRNKRFKDKEYGFIPMSWKLVKITDGKAEPIKSGICDFALTKDGGIYCTNGRHIFYLKDGSCKKVADPDMCLSLATESVSEVDGGLFGF